MLICDRLWTMYLFNISGSHCCKHYVIYYSSRFSGPNNCVG
ncbi:hypothetical protein BC938DRAFT_477328 [Jimgerdemannia flammicorona]|uniref:Uncharacterized protein n=1 Tax=Jimgerdemannia flammicorona TaxID=994334 RepID=A0A433QPH9_9FUNG|nr:hypothetical protein BC938DRAFT_477328 [Jimgerdemannia flammicorona]